MNYVKRLMELDYKQMFDKMKRIHDRSGKMYPWIFYDIVRCSKKFGSGYVDYCNFHFEELSDELKATYVTRVVNDNYCKKLNDPKSYDIVNDKPTFLKKYKEFVKRDFLDLREADYDAFLAFCDKHSDFIVKPVDQLCGSGIEKIVVIKGKEKEIYDTLMMNKQYLLEECIIQDEAIGVLNPSSINTIRVVTILKDDVVYFPFIALRMGRKDSVVDNFNHGGLNALVSKSGVVTTVGVTKNEAEYAVHPDSGVPILGFQIPNFEEVLKFAEELARVTPSLGMCGWDLCLAKDKGVVAIEGNHLPGYDLYQCYGHRSEDKKGRKPDFDAIIYGDKN